MRLLFLRKGKRVVHLDFEVENASLIETNTIVQFRKIACQKTRSHRVNYFKLEGHEIQFTHQLRND